MYVCLPPMMRARTLLDDIKAEISAAGGRHHLAFAIMNESPNWFTHKEIQFAREKIYQMNHMQRKRAALPVSERIWTTEDIKTVRKKFGKVSTSCLAKDLKRTPTAVREKFYEQATAAEKEWVKLHGKYAGRVNNLKNK